MDPTDPNNILLQLIQATLSPHKAQADGQRVELPLVKDMILVDKYVRGLIAAGIVVNGSAGGPPISASLSISQAGRTWGIGFAKFIPPAGF